MVEQAGVRIVKLDDGKYEFYYSKYNNALLATAEEITSKANGDFFDGYIVITGRVSGEGRSILFGVKINNTDIVYHDRMITSAITRLTSAYHKPRFDNRGRVWGKFIKRIVILDKTCASGRKQRVYRDDAAPVCPAHWIRYIEPRIGEDFLPWYLGNRTNYFR